jgi:hypothetical protein
VYEKNLFNFATEIKKTGDYEQACITQPSRFEYCPPCGRRAISVGKVVGVCVQINKK